VPGWNSFLRTEAAGIASIDHARSSRQRVVPAHALNQVPDLEVDPRAARVWSIRRQFFLRPETLMRAASLSSRGAPCPSLVCLRPRCAGKGLGWQP